MAKKSRRGTRLPLHTRIDGWLRSEINKYLDDEHEEIVDLAFRQRSGLGPAGWSVVIRRTVLGESRDHGLVFPVSNKPTCREVMQVAQTGRAALDKASRQSQLVVTPEESKKLLAAPPRIDQD